MQGDTHQGELDSEGIDLGVDVHSLSLGHSLGLNRRRSYVGRISLRNRQKPWNTPFTEIPLVSLGRHRCTCAADLCVAHLALRPLKAAAPAGPTGAQGCLLRRESYNCTRLAIAQVKCLRANHGGLWWERVIHPSVPVCPLGIASEAFVARAVIIFSYDETLLCRLLARLGCIEPFEGALVAEDTGFAGHWGTWFRGSDQFNFVLHKELVYNPCSSLAKRNCDGLITHKSLDRNQELLESYLFM